MAKHEIHFLKGVHDTGKSTTIKNLFLLLMKKYHETIKIISLDINENGNDITVIIIINDVKIGIESEGDLEEELELSLNKFKDAECNIIFCPARSHDKNNAGTIHRIYSYEKSGYKVIPYDQIVKERKSKSKRSKTQDKSNMKTAEDLIKAAGL